MSSVRARRSETRWVTRSMPVFLAVCFGLTTYTTAKRVCVDHFLHRRQEPSAAIAFLVFYLVTFTFMLLTYIRLFLVIQLNPGVVPLGQRAIWRLEKEEKEKPSWRRHKHKQTGDIEANAYSNVGPDDDPDSPGLESFYSKDVFICESDGKPRWCHSCCTWKPDRAHHCSEIDRCVKKMDHYCPWVGGIVGETSFKYFIQFTFYASLCSIVVITACAVCTRQRLHTGHGPDGFVVAILALSGLLGFFAVTMFITSARYALQNMTNIDYLKSKNFVHNLAIRVPRGIQSCEKYKVVTYPISKSGDLGTPLPGDVGARGVANMRDMLATRTFAVVKTELGENPWDLGFYRNWKSVMGNSIIDWLLPLKDSPCATYENNESFYEMGPIYLRVRERFRLPHLTDDEKGFTTSKKELSSKSQAKERKQKKQEQGSQDRAHGSANL
ncbi:DHHC palmitoyltransferase-domain-containing protein [Neurospora crassa]|nr:DHHC palmitoyltransferase-domain-containing protein [Neurospora crassa]